MKYVLELRLDEFDLDAYMEAGSPSIRAIPTRSIITLPMESMLKATLLMSSTSTGRNVKIGCLTVLVSGPLRPFR